MHRQNSIKSHDSQSFIFAMGIRKENFEKWIPRSGDNLVVTP